MKIILAAHAATENWQHSATTISAPPAVGDVRRLQCSVLAGPTHPNRHTTLIYSLAVVRVQHSLMLVSSSWDKTVKLWDVADGGGRHVRTVEVGSDVNGITSLGGDEGRVVCGCDDHTVRVYDMNDGSCLQIHCVGTVAVFIVLWRWVVVTLSCRGAMTVACVCGMCAVVS